MRTPLLSVMAAALLASTGAGANDLMSLNQFPHRVEPVLVQVDAMGKVTRASPAYDLSPKLTRLLQANLSEMIRKPATDKRGKAVSSQFIMNVALQAKPNGAGDYDAHFSYVSTRPVPPGSWYWVHLDGDRLALTSQDMLPSRARSSVPVEFYEDDYRPTYRGNSQPAPTPAIQSAPRVTASVSPPPTHAH